MITFFKFPGNGAIHSAHVSDSLIYLKSFPDNFFDLGCTDIPYGISVTKLGFARTTERKVVQANGKVCKIKRKNKYCDESIHWDQDIPSKEWFMEFSRVTKHQIFYGIDKLEDDFILELGLGSGRIKWNKGVAEKSSFKKFEFAYCSFIDHEEEIKFLWSGMFQGRSRLEPMKAHGNKKLHEERLHPTQKPIVMWELVFEFAKKHIDFSTVVDPFCGVMSMAKGLENIDDACQWYGVDQERNYINLGVKRWNVQDVVEV